MCKCCIFDISINHKTFFMQNFTLKFGKYKGQQFLSTPVNYQNWLLVQDWFKMPSQELKPPTISKNWDGYSRKGQAQEQSYFEYEMAMADKYDPIPDFYNFI